MEVRDLDGNIVKWVLTGRLGNNKSELHKITRELIKEEYPTIQFLEEVTVNLRRGQVVYLDFYLPLYKIAIECSGEQHYKYIPHFHGSPQGFAKAKQCDQMKKDWCELNDIKLIELPFNENKEQWRNRLRS